MSIPVEFAADEPLALKRRLAAVAFADIAGFSTLIAANDVVTLRRWKALRTDLMEPLMRRFGGRVSETSGDSVLVEFASAVNAVRWATLVQRGHAARVDPADPFALQLRIGINVDDLIDDDGVLQGDGVNIAARIHQAAEPGQVVVTGRVRNYVRNRLPLTFRDLGSPPMKNIARPVQVYAVEWNEVGEGRVIAQPYVQWSSRPTIAVLPFRNIGGRGDEDYFGEGITDEIISVLSRSRSMYVIARQSTLRYRGREKDARQIAAELDVRYLLDGSFWRIGNRLRIRVELLDVSAGHSLWSRRFEDDDHQVFRIQDEIAASVIGSMEPRLREVEIARASERPTDSLDAYHCVLKAMSRLYLFTDESFAETGVLIDRALELDPAYAQAHAYRAWRLNFVLGEGRSPDLPRDRAAAVEAARRGLAIDPDDTFVVCVAAHLTSFAARRVEEAYEAFERALERDENSAFAWGLSSLTCSYRGQSELALERLQNVWRLNPYDPLSFFFWFATGLAEFVGGRHADALAWCRRAVRANPRFVAAWRFVAATAGLEGHDELARSAAREILAAEPDFSVCGFLSWYPMSRPADVERLARGLLAAGIPAEAGSAAR